jgi:formylmethanofuran dehydrogenase subunit E
MNDHDYRYEALKDQEYDRNRRVVKAIMEQNYHTSKAETFTNYIMQNCDVTGISLRQIALLADDLFVCDQCGEAEDNDQRSDLFEHEDICLTCAGNGQ